MKRFTINTKTALGWGLALVLLWLLSNPSTGLPVAHAAELRVCSTCTYTTIQDAVDAASPGDVIKVAADTYTGVQARAGVTQVVYIDKSVTIRGGYTTADWATPDPAANLTTLDAQGQGRVIYVTGNISPTIEGLRITNGDASGLGGAAGMDAGGGVYVIIATATISNNQVFSNTADFGGGLYLSHSDNATLRANTITSNTAYWGAGGGGGLLLDNSDATLIANTVAANTADGGGGLSLCESDATLIANTVSSNTADDGGGLALASSAATLIANTVSSNTATYDGGGLYLLVSDATLSANTVTANTAGYGGGLRLYESAATLSANTVTSNTATYNGGGLDLTESDATLTNNVVADNRANIRGSGLYIMVSSSRLLHNTIARNSGGDGSGVYVTGWDLGPYSSVVLTNTILVSHTVGITVSAGNTATLESTLWQGNTNDTGGAGLIMSGTNNYSGDPAFVNPDAGDYHVRETSAAIDKGVDAGVTTDIDGDPRPYGSAPDLGADEQSVRVYLPIIRK